MNLFADETSDLLELAQETQGYAYMGELVNMLLTLGVIIALICITIFVLKKVMRSRVQSVNRTTGIHVLERRGLGQKNAIYLIDVLGKGLIISESPAGIQLLSEFSEGTNVELLLEQIQLEQSSGPSFREKLTLKLRKMTTKKPELENV